MVQSALRPFQTPIPFDFHFSKYHYQDYVQSPNQYIQTMHGTDSDLAAHLTIMNHYGQVLTGRPLRKYLVQFHLLFTGRL